MSIVLFYWFGTMMPGLSYYGVEARRFYPLQRKSFCTRTTQIIPTRCRNLHLCLEDIVPAILIILITHIIIAVRWMLIKILSAVINHLGRVNTVVSGGCYPNNGIIRKTGREIKIHRHFCERTAKHGDTFSESPCSLIVINLW